MSGRVHKITILLTAIIVMTVSCMDYGPMQAEEFDWSGTATGDGLFIINEGNFMYGNASLSYYSISGKRVVNGIFARVNGEVLGDVAQSMVIRDGRGYVVVNNSGVIFIIDIDNGYVIGTVEGLLSPRYVHFLSDTKAYVTDLYASKITIFNPKTGAITGEIPTPRHMSTEQMVQSGKYVFVNCWSYDNTILVVDTDSDTIVDEITVGIQPTSMVIDKNEKIWVLTDGGYEGSPYGWGDPALYRIDAATRNIEKTFWFDMDDSPSEICLNGKGDQLYFINNSVWRMAVTDEQLPVEPFVEYRKTTKYYGLAVHPVTSEVYVADAIDYAQRGIVYRYSAEGELLDSFNAGITPGSFCFR